MVDWYFNEVVNGPYHELRASVKRVWRVARHTHDVGRLRSLVAGMRFQLAKIEALCYKIEQEQSEEVM